MVNLDLYRVFYTVAKCGSLTKAADELFISQPAVSQAIKQLEKQLGGKLFNRVARGMELTEDGGKQMYAIVSDVLERLDKAENEFANISNYATGSIRISSSDTFTAHYIMKYIVEYHSMYPKVNISFVDSSTKQSIELIKANKADIAFVNLPLEEKGVTFTGQTGRVHDIFAANKEFSALFGKEIKLSSLQNYPILLLDTTTNTRQEIDKFTNELNIKITPEYELSSVELIVAMAKNGMGIACVPREYISEELKSGQLVELNVTPAMPARLTGVIVNKDRSYSFALAEFLKLLNKYERSE